MRKPQIEVRSRWIAKVKGKEVRVVIRELLDDEKKARVTLVKGGKKIKIKQTSLLRPLENEISEEHTDENPAGSNRGFTHYQITWDDNRINFKVMVNGIRFYGDWRKVDNLGACAVDIRCTRGKESHLCYTIPYPADPRPNLKSLDSDLCAAITRWLHDHPFPGSCCAFCGCADHQVKEPGKECVAYQRRMIEQQKVFIRCVETIDTLIIRLREFRDTAIRCGGARGFEIVGDSPASAKVWLDVDLTSQAVLLKGKTPALGSMGRIDSMVNDEDDGEDNDGEDSESRERTRAEPRSRKGPSSGNVADLVARLNSTEDSKEKRKLRAALRKIGHSGGARSVKVGE